MPAEVKLYVYDLTRGLAASLSPMLLGKQIEGVWHTGLVVHGHEYFFGYGISKMDAGTTPFGAPARVIDLGVTEAPASLVDELVADLQPRFRPEDYNVIAHNCNNFSNELAQLLVGDGIPDDILLQAFHILDSPMGAMLEPMILQMEGITGRMAAHGFVPPQATDAAAAFGNGVVHTAAAAMDRMGSGLSSASSGGGPVRVPVTTPAQAGAAAAAAAAAVATAPAAAAPAATGGPQAAADAQRAAGAAALARAGAAQGASAEGAPSSTEQAAAPGAPAAS